MTDIGSDSLLLRIIQQGIPLVREPFAQIATQLSGSEEQILDRLRTLHHEGVIREISAIFDSQALGYRQTLVA